MVIPSAARMIITVGDIPWEEETTIVQHHDAMTKF